MPVMMPGMMPGMGPGGMPMPNPEQLLQHFGGRVSRLPSTSPTTSADPHPRGPLLSLRHPPSLSFRLLPLP